MNAAMVQFVQLTVQPILILGDWYLKLINHAALRNQSH